ncbi:MAG: DUF975 family protein [Anaerovoracaceae bacterium]
MLFNNASDSKRGDIVMFRRGELKRNARHSIKRNYWSVVAVCFLMSVLMFEYGASMEGASTYDKSRETDKKVVVQTIKNTIASDIVNVGSDDKPEAKATKGVLAAALNAGTSTLHILSNAKVTFHEFFIEHSFIKGFVAILAVLASIAYTLLFKNIVIIGERRFFLENRVYEKSKISRVLSIYISKKTFLVAKTMLLVNLMLILWAMTVILYPYKHYQYKLVSYIMAENPEIHWKDAIALSKEMMKGYKWNAFLLDCSFILWNGLNLLTFGLAGIFFTNMYYRATETELFVKLREFAKVNNIKNIDLLNDNLLYEAPALEEPLYYPGTHVEKEHKQHINYKRKYSITNLILFFFTFSVIGWIWEVSLHLVKDGVFVKRGIMFGPWLPIYGAGGVLVLILLKKFIDKPVVTFVLTMVICGIVEYSTSYYLEMTKGAKWWDYSGYLLNINGRVCLEGLLVFAIGGTAFIYIIAPFFDSKFNKIPKRNRNILCAILLTLFGADAVYSHYYPNVGKGITDYGIEYSQVTGRTHNIKRLN